MPHRAVDTVSRAAAGASVKIRLLCVLLLGLAACGGGGGSTGGSTGTVAAPAALSYPSPQTAVVGMVFTPVTPTVTGTVSSYSVSPALPAGLALNASTGQISGTPTAATPTAAYTITAQNSGGATTFSLSLTVNPATTAALEPSAATTIGTGQRINLFFVQRVGGAPYPSYVDGTLVTWSSSNPGRATVDASGNVTGVAEGATTITAQFQTFSLQLPVQVSGAWIARTLSVPGQGVRRYAIYVPSGLGGAGPRPALLAFHGGTGTAMGMAASSQLAKFAQERQIYAVFPEGSGTLQTFNGGACCGTAQSQNVDDVAFTRAVIADVRANYGIDAARIYATGFSNGGIMAHRLACGLADQLAGVAPVGGASGEFDGAGTRYYTCSPARPITVLHIHATNDRNYPYAGGIGSDGISTTNFYGVDATITNWIARNNVTNQAVEERIGASTTCRRHAAPADGSRPSAPVVICRVDPPDVYDTVNRIVFGGGHSWPGGVRSPTSNSDVPIQDFNANAYLWGQLNP
jgi:polyhydroxybutyrate depolymerase